MHGVPTIRARGEHPRPVVGLSSAMTRFAAESTVQAGLPERSVNRLCVTVPHASSYAVIQPVISAPTECAARVRVVAVL